MWAVEHAGVEPDVLLAPRASRAACRWARFVARAELMETWGAGAHGSTFGGNPVPCAAGLATLETIREEGLLAHATEVGDFLLGRLAELPGRCPGLVTDVRGIGLMIGVEFRTAEQAEAAQQGSFERGLLVLECGETTRTDVAAAGGQPDQAKTALDLLGATLAELARSSSARTSSPASPGRPAGRGQRDRLPRSSTPPAGATWTAPAARSWSGSGTASPRWSTRSPSRPRRIDYVHGTAFASESRSRRTRPSWRRRAAGRTPGSTR